MKWEFPGGRGHFPVGGTFPGAGGHFPVGFPGGMGDLQVTYKSNLDLTTRVHILVRWRGGLSTKSMSFE